MDKKNLGYTKPLFILPFDHRGTFFKKMYNVSEQDAKPEVFEQIKEFKKIIYEGFETAVRAGIPKDQAAILVDEQFGDEIIRDALSRGHTVIYTTEKSGQDEFDFEYGEQFGEHIEKYKPQVVKALLRYNPEGDPELNRRQRYRLKILGDYCHAHGHKFLIEPLIPATDAQLDAVSGSGERYDDEVRPKLMTVMMQELQKDGVEPDIWKIEGLNKRSDYVAVLQTARADGRDHVSAVILGRNASVEQVERWLTAGKGLPGVVGFAIGRTIFWEALLAFKENKLDRAAAVEKIAKSYKHFYDLFVI